jgi:hypothetical protein
MVQNDWMIVLDTGIKGPDSDDSSEHQIQAAIEGPGLHSPRVSRLPRRVSRHQQTIKSVNQPLWARGKKNSGHIEAARNRIWKHTSQLELIKLIFLPKSSIVAIFFLLPSSRQFPGLVAGNAKFKLWTDGVDKGIELGDYNQAKFHCLKTWKLEYPHDVSWL